jgi:HlyD family secretion protein
MIVAFVTVWAAHERHPDEPVQVTTALLTRGSVVRRIIAVGTLQAVTTVQVGAQVSGTVQSLNADFNSIVRTGEVLARLDPSLLEAAEREAQAAVVRAEAAEAQVEADARGLEVAVEDADAKLTRAQKLASSDLIPQSDLDVARTAVGEADTDLQGGESRVEQAKAAVAEAEAAVRQAAVNVDHTVITSPIDGIVVGRSVDVGQTVAATVEAPVLFTIASDVRRMQVNVEIDEADVDGVREGEHVAFEVEAYPTDTFNGSVSQIRLQPVSSPGSETVAYTTIIDVDNQDGRLRPGMTATVAIVGARRNNVVRIPNNALAFRPSLDVLTAVAQPQDAPPSGSEAMTDSSRRRVWRYDGSRFIPVEIRVGLSDAEWTELASGPLGAGDALVTAARVRPAAFGGSRSAGS